MNLLIAGASSGLGLELAKFYANSSVQQFSNIACVARRAAPSPTLVRTESVDISNPGEVDSFLQNLPFDVTHLVCTVGSYGHIGSILDCSTTDIFETININLIAPLLLTKKVAARMSEGVRGGRIILLFGGGASVHQSGSVAYTTAKYGLARFVEAVCEDFFDRGILINCVAPGLMPSQFVDQARESSHLLGDDLRKKLDSVSDLNFNAPVRMIDALLTDHALQFTGKLLSATFDDLSDREFVRSLTYDDDLCTMRRLK
jgi:short-subunit dehydrogenase